MNMADDEHSVNWLFLDLNSFFASCEQQDRPELRGRPVAVVQAMIDSTSAIAVSAEAKKFGVKTGTLVWEAKKLCPSLIFVQARHKRYSDYHRQIIEAVESCLPVTKVASIDEVACRLMGSERSVAAANELARNVKQAIRSKVGHCMTCSVGLAPSLFLGKVASDMQKPDGLVTITKKDLPHALHRLSLTDIYGIGTRMEFRLNRAGIGTVEDLMRASRSALRQAWGGINGVLYYELLHGADLQFPSATYSKSISHQHVLEPELRTTHGAYEFAQHLLAKAGERLRHKGYYARRLGIGLSSREDSGRFWNEMGFHETQDTNFLLARLTQVWQQVPRMQPLKVAVVLFGLVPVTQHQADLFVSNDPVLREKERLSPIMDRINRRYGRGAISFGKPMDMIAKFTSHAAFQRIPEEFEV